MTRLKNPLSSVQQDDEQFAATRSTITAITPKVLSKELGVSRTSFFKYMRKEPVNYGVEYRILLSILAYKGIDHEGETDLLKLAEMATCRKPTLVE